MQLLPRQAVSAQRSMAQGGQAWNQGRPAQGCRVAVEAPSSLITPACNMHAQPQMMRPAVLRSHATQGGQHTPRCTPCPPAMQLRADLSSHEIKGCLRARHVKVAGHHCNAPEGVGAQQAEGSQGKWLVGGGTAGGFMEHTSLESMQALNKPGWRACRH